MDLDQLELGAVVLPSWDDARMRVLAHDERTVMYDAWRPDLNVWSFAGAGKGKVVYYRLVRDFFVANSRYLYTERLSGEEFSLHRPDLALEIACCESLDWSDLEVGGVEELSKILVSAGFSVTYLNTVIPCRSLYLEPFGPRGGHRAATKVAASSEEGFSVLELMHAAWMTQAPHMSSRRLTDGIGIYRSGLQGRLPSFYLWGSKPMHLD